MKVDWATLGDVVRLAQDAVAVQAEETYPSAGVLNRGRGLFDKGMLAGSDTSYGRLFRLRAGQVVYSKLFGWEGAVALVPDAFDGYFVSSEFPTFDVASDRVMPDYLAHYLKSAKFTDEMARSTNGLGQRRQRVNIEAFSRIPIPLPQLPEQEKVALHLSQFDARRRDSVTHHDVIAGLMTNAVSLASPEPLGSLLELSRHPLELVAGVTYRRIGIYSWGKGVLRRDPATVAEMGSMRYFRFPIPSLIFSNIQAWEGAVALAGNEDRGYVCSSRFYPYVARKEADVSLRYLLEYFRTKEGVEQLRQASPGTQVRNKVLSRSMLEATRVPVPAPSVQRHVAAQAQILERIQATKSRATRLESAILPAARNGIFDSMR